MLMFFLVQDGLNGLFCIGALLYSMFILNYVDDDLKRKTLNNIVHDVPNWGGALMTISIRIV